MSGGTEVVMLFSDVERSTGLARRAGDDWPAVLAAHRRLMRDAIRAAGGRIELAEGDAFFATFPDAEAAVEAALAAQRATRTYAWPASIGALRVRMGVHRGVVEHTDGHYVGLEVHRAARIADAAHGGQVLVSAAVHAALEAVDSTDLGEHRLKDFPEPERLFGVRAEPGDRFPPPRTLGGAASALLIERDRDLAALVALADALVNGRASGCVRIAGPAGAGKTSLLAAVTELARARGARVLAARASEFEHDVPLGVVRQLLEPPLAAAAPEERAQLTAGLARLAADALDLAGERPPPEPAAARHGFFWLTANLAAERPVLVTVDDAQWADLPSLQYVAYLARRLEGHPVAIALTERTGVPGAHVDVLADLPGSVLRPRPLSLEGVEALARHRLGGRASAALVAELHRSAAGNPFLTEELLRSPEALAEGAVAEGLASASILRRVGASGGPRLAVARAIAILDEDADVRRVAALAGVGDEGAALVDVLTDAELLEPGRPLRFAHPIVRGVVYDGVGESERARLHGRAAELLAADGIGADRVAAHLLHAEPAGEPAVAARLLGAAVSARRRGATGTAIDLLQRALREPPAAADRAGVVVELGLAELDSGRVEGIAHLLGALPEVDDPFRRAVVAAAAAGAMARQGDAADGVALLDGVIDAIGDRELALALEAHRALAGRSDLRTLDAARARLHAQAKDLTGETPGERRLLAVAALVDPPGGTQTAQELADLCLRAVIQRDEVRDELTPMGLDLLPVSLTIAGRSAEALELLDRTIADARRRGSFEAYSMAIGMRGHVHYECGALTVAEADLRASLDGERLDPWLAAPSVGVLLLVLVARGELDVALALLADHGFEGELPAIAPFIPLSMGRARLRIALGRRAEGLADLLELGARQARMATTHPEPPWRLDAAAALRREGRDAEACRVAGEYVEIARRWGAPRPIGMALRARALVDDEPSIPLLEESVAVLAGSAARLEHAESLVELGAALRRANRRADARVPLREGLDIAHRCGATPLAERAAQELRATGARPRRAVLSGAESLTASERRVAQLAAAGHTNREIAQDLFVTLNTVESHMRHVFQKLGVSRRTDLAAALPESP